MPEDLIQIVNAALQSAVARSGGHLACRAGCSQCCHGVFEISALDGHRLRQGLAQADVVLQGHIQGRLVDARTHLAPFFPGDVTTGVLSTDSDQVELFEEWAHADPCPILNPVTQTCDLYAHRPMLCRTFGPPIRNDANDLTAGLAICELCFTDADEEDIAAAEVDSSFRALQGADEDAFAAAHLGTGPTIVAFAFGTPVC